MTGQFNESRRVPGNIVVARDGNIKSTIRRVGGQVGQVGEVEPVGRVDLLRQITLIDFDRLCIVTAFDLIDLGEGREKQHQLRADCAGANILLLRLSRPGQLYMTVSKDFSVIRCDWTIQFPRCRNDDLIGWVVVKGLRQLGRCDGNLRVQWQ